MEHTMSHLLSVHKSERQERPRTTHLAGLAVKMHPDRKAAESSAEKETPQGAEIWVQHSPTNWISCSEVLSLWVPQPTQKPQKDCD